MTHLRRALVMDDPRGDAVFLHLTQLLDQQLLRDGHCLLCRHPCLRVRSVAGDLLHIDRPHRRIAAALGAEARNSATIQSDH